MRRIKQYFKPAIAGAWIGAISLLCISVLDEIDNDLANRVISITVGIVFWSSLIFEQIMFWRSVSMREKSSCTLKETNSYPIGLISFFSTSKGMMADIALIVSLVALIVIVISGESTSKLIYPLVAAIYLSFNLHCLYNGRHYRLIFKK